MGLAAGVYMHMIRKLRWGLHVCIAAINFCLLAPGLGCANRSKHAHDNVDKTVLSFRKGMGESLQSR